MKKSFKKAGAAVLSMAMLLSMGAISMPVYADDYTATTVRPGHVKVKIGMTSGGASTYKQGQGDGEMDDNGLAPTNYKYDYLSLSGVTEATVELYRVATLTGENGWKWEDYVTTAAGGNPIPGFTNFENLYAKTKTGDNYDDIDSYFTTSSDDLKSLSYFLERAALTGGTAISSVKLDNDTFNTGKELPTLDVDALDTNGNGKIDPNETTANVIGYYVIVTKTDQSGVLVQPVLVSLKNGVLRHVGAAGNNQTGDNYKEITLKGSTIDMYKQITDVYQAETEYEEAGILKTDEGKVGGKSAVVSKKDIVHYEISAQLPEYDPNLPQSSIQDIVFTDTMSNGLTVLSDTIQVYLSTDDESQKNATDRAASVADNWYLVGSNDGTADYTWSVGTTKDNHNLIVTITGGQMRQGTRIDDGGTPADTSDDTEVGDTGTPANGTISSTTAPANDIVINRTQKVEAADFATGKAYEGKGVNIGEMDTMEGKYIIISYDAVVDRSDAGAKVDDEDDIAFDRSYTAAKTAKNLGADDWNIADTTVAGTDDTQKQIDEAKIFGKTRYNKTYTADTYKEDVFKTFAADTATKSAMEAIAKAASGNDGMTFEEFFITGEDAEANRIHFMLALDKANIELNGENNKAKMSYGNRYSNGGKDDVAYLNTDYSKVYSVNLSLDKFVERSELTLMKQYEDSDLEAFFAEYGSGIDLVTETVADTDVATVVTADMVNKTMKEIAEAFGETVADDATDEAIKTQLDGLGNDSDYKKALGRANTTGVDAPGTDDYQKAYAMKLLDDENTRRSALAAGAVTDNGRLTAAKAIAAATGSAMAAYKEDDNAMGLILAALDAENAKRAAVDGYTEDTIEEPVKGAVFQLIKNYTTDPVEAHQDSDGNVKDNLGYAITDANGHLNRLYKAMQVGSNYYKVTPSTGVQGTQLAAADLLYEDSDGNKYYDSGETVWNMLDIGQYELLEVKVPVGFKKWDSVTFTITADDSTFNDITGEYTGKYSATTVINTDANANASHGFGNLADTRDTSTGATKTLTFNYAEGTGTLSHKLYNEFFDELPATGGMGTVLFTAGGISIVLIAGALFVMYMKKRNAEEEE